MAKLLLGPIASDLRGKIGGTVASKNKGGNYLRRGGSPVQPNTPAQTQARANFGANSKLWSAMFTADQRAAWGFFAAANPLVNIFGASIIISGMAMSMRLNQILTQIAQATITDPPADMSVPALAAATAIAPSTITGLFQVVTEVQSVVAGAQYYVFATGLMAAGAKPQKNQYRFMGAYSGTAGGLAINISDAWIARFGALAAGQSVGVIVATVNVATGALTPGIVFWALVA